jgi:2,4-didehydro-3-deoxy-L-rhamnonate hydrolase
MKLMRVGPKGLEKPAVLLPSGEIKDCSGLFSDWNSAFFAHDGLKRLQGFQAQFAALPTIPAEVRVGSCVARPGKVICIGLNYRDHAEESGMAIPQEPVVFMKATNTVVGPYDQVLIPRGSEKTDWEVELGVVIGKEARYLESVEAAKACVAGYCVSHDVSERAFQLERGGQWTKGKSCDTFNPLGPWLVTTDEIKSTANLDMYLKVNGEQMQQGNTGTMIFNVEFIVHYLSQFMTLEPGDVITTGTPPGVGLGKKPARFLKAGDTVELSVAGLGVQRQIFLAA